MKRISVYCLIVKMENDFGEKSLPSLLSAMNGILKNDIKCTEDTLKLRRIIGNSQIHLKDSIECSVALDCSMVSTAFQYYCYEKNNKSMCLGISNLSNNIWNNNDALIKDIGCALPLESNNDLNKTLSELQMDPDLISELPKFNTDFLNLYNFFDEQIEPIGGLNTSISEENKINEIDFSNSAIVDTEMNNSNSKEHSNGLNSTSSENGCLLETNENLGTKSIISNYDVSSSQHTVNTEENSIISQSCNNKDYFPEELDYEPSDKESNSEFCIGNISKCNEEGSFENSCPQDAASENSDVLKEKDDMHSSENYAEHSVDEDFVSVFQNNFELVPSENVYERRFEYDDEESESDIEHSFKRKSSRKRELTYPETAQQPIIQQPHSHIPKVTQFDSVDEVLFYICEQCEFGNINEAISIADKYIALGDEAIQFEIFKELFINVINLIKSSVLPDDVISKTLGSIMQIFHHSKLFYSDLCSLIISDCFGCDQTIKIGVKLFSFIQNIKVPVDDNAISTYTDTIITEEISLLELILFMEYVKSACDFLCPKALLSKALGHFSKEENGTLPPGFSRLCTILCSIDSSEVDANDLQSFIEFCIKNDCWTEMASFFQAWHKDGHLLDCLSCSFLFMLEDVGLFFKKFTEEIYKNEDMSLYLMGILGQMGVSLMLEVFAKKQYESAFLVLFTLHKHNINYMELQACLYNAPCYLKSLPEFSDMFVFPFTVAFAALDICLHLKRFRDAYRIAKSFSLNLPEDMEDKWKLRVKSQRFGYLLKLTQELYLIEPLKLGLQAFYDMSSAAKDFSLDELENSAKEIQTIYNKYLAYVINGCQLHTALELFEYSEGLLKEIFIIYPQVLRSLLVMFAQNGKMDEAHKFFLLGCTRKIYDIQQVKMNESVWRLIIMSSWTILEVEFVINAFLENIFLAWNEKQKKSFDIQPLVQILFEESLKDDCLDIECLQKSRSLRAAKEISCNVLKSLDPNIEWAENENPIRLDLVPRTIYNHWINTKDRLQEKHF